MYAYENKTVCSIALLTDAEMLWEDEPHWFWGPWFKVDGTLCLKYPSYNHICYVVITVLNEMNVENADMLASGYSAVLHEALRHGYFILNAKPSWLLYTAFV